VLDLALRRMMMRWEVLGIDSALVSLPYAEIVVTLYPDPVAMLVG